MTELPQVHEFKGVGMAKVKRGKRAGGATRTTRGRKLTRARNGSSAGVTPSPQAKASAETGVPSQPKQLAKAIDTTRDFTGHLPWISENEVVAVGRYYSVNTWKILTYAEAQALRAAGLKVFTVYQDLQNRPSSFSAPFGKRAARNASEYAKNVIKQPVPSTLFFAVDYDASAADLSLRVVPFFEAISIYFRQNQVPYDVGVYGNGLVCGTLLDQGLVRHTWLSMSTGHRGSKAFAKSGRWSIKQLKEFDHPLSHDTCVVVANDFGGF